MFEFVKMSKGEIEVVATGNGPAMRLQLVDLITRLIGVASVWSAVPDGKFASVAVDWDGRGHGMTHYFVRAL